MNLKFNALIIKNIEKTINNQSIVNILGDNSIKSLETLIAASHVNEDGSIGVKGDRALELIDEYVAEGRDTYELMLDIMDALKANGFLPKGIDVAKMREEMTTQVEQAMDQLGEA
ncbi:MAG: hypothetical protein FWD45_00260 [Coriobacteriia bacterium]|nr:hypothetical protein [Coriobacteriia bacterium]